MARKKTPRKSVKALTHDSAKRTNIPTAEHQSVMSPDEQAPVRVAYQRRNPDVDPQLVWRGKDMQSWSELVVQAAPLYIQEKVHPKVLIDDLQRRTQADEQESAEQPDLFADFNGLPDGAEKTEFYRHDANWSNRMILGDSLQVMASLAEREGLRGKVQCIYIDPPYGIKFNSNFQWSTTSRIVQDGETGHITREPEQVKAFRDTWRDGIHSYLTYLRDRLTVARDLLTESGSIFVQIGEENMHRVRGLLDEVFGPENFVSMITFTKTSPLRSKLLPRRCDFILWYAADKERIKYRPLHINKPIGEDSGYQFVEAGVGERRRMTSQERDDPETLPRETFPFSLGKLASTGFTKSCYYDFEFEGWTIKRQSHSWITTADGMRRLIKADRLWSGTSKSSSGRTPNYIQKHSDFPVKQMDHLWPDLGGATGIRYVVETNTKVIQRCILMTTDPGDLVLDPTCGSGTTAYVAEQWGRRWITIDTSRVALALARARIMGARYPYYLLADSPEGQKKEAEVTRTAPSEQPTYGDIRQGFVYERVPHITLRSIANNAEIDVIWEKYQEKLEPLRAKLNKALKKKWEEYQIPPPENSDEDWPAAARQAHAAWWEQRIARQKEIDASIAAKADFEYLFDKPYENKKVVRVAGPFTVESLSPHRVLAVDENDELIEHGTGAPAGNGAEPDFAQMILENLKIAGVQQAHREDKFSFTSLEGWPGKGMICAEGSYVQDAVASGEGGRPVRAGIFIGPEFGTVSRPDLVQAAREAGEAGFDVLISCAFSYDARSSEFDSLGRIPVLKARMNADLHMAEDLRRTDRGNLFVIFGEPDIEIIKDGDEQIRVKVKGVDVFHPQSGEIRSDGPEGIACWFIDTDYNEEHFLVRQAYFLGADDPYKALKSTLKAEINEEAWATLHSDTSRPFPKPQSGRIAVKVINHLGDEVMKVFKV